MWNFTEDYCAQISKNTENVIKQHGYPLEKHSVTTEDGYILSMYRIPHGKQNSQDNNNSRPPVLLSHGLGCSSAIFVNESRLGYYFADEGYDVWLPNNRGTTFSRKHTTLDAQKDKDKYWDFSWHEIGKYDTPAFIDYILDYTGYQKLHFIGHSQGATVYGVLGSERPEYNDKIALCCLLGPPLLFENNSSIILKFLTRGLVPFMEVLHYYLKLPIYETPGSNLTRALGSIARQDSISSKIAHFVLFLIAGHPNYDQINLDFPQFCLTTPSSCSIRQIYHYCQIVRNQRFAKYDYGPEKNMKLYGTEKPPLYDLSKITSPVALFCGSNDMYTYPKDVDNLEKMMGNVVLKYTVDYDKFNHVDFLMAKDSIPLLYSHISNIMKKYKPDKSTGCDI